MSDFVHLHVHSDYSLLDGAASVKKLVSKAKELLDERKLELEKYKDYLAPQTMQTADKVE